MHYFCFFCPLILARSFALSLSMPPSKEPILDWIPPDPGLDFFVDDGELFDLPDAADAEVDFLSAAIRTPEIRSSSFLRFSSSRSLLRISLSSLYPYPLFLGFLAPSETSLATSASSLDALSMPRIPNLNTSNRADFIVVSGNEEGFFIFFSGIALVASSSVSCFLFRRIPNLNPSNRA